MRGRRPSARAGLRRLPGRHPRRPLTAPPAPVAEPAGLYLHVPFCSAVCPYCDFAVAVGGAASRQRFVAALRTEIACVAGEIAAAEQSAAVGAAEAAGGAPGRSVDDPAMAPARAGFGGFTAGFDTVYFGGGTPSALSPAQLGEILGALAADLRVRTGGPPATGGRIFLEANPEDVTAESLAAWRALGVETLSLGVQSFDPAALAFLGRRHSPRRGEESVTMALAAGFSTVSLDLIYGLPGQTAAAWRRELEAAIALGPDHLSCYQLTVEAGTPFGRRRERGELRELPDAGQAELFRLTHELLAAAGWPAYEVSSFARAPEHRSRHNRKYWRHAPYLGLGPSAHSFDGSRRRWWNERRLGPWHGHLGRGSVPVAGSETLTPVALALERLMLALRTVEGLDLARFRRDSGVDLAATSGPTLERLLDAGLARVQDGCLALTLDGLVVADGLAALFDLTPAAEPGGGHDAAGR